ncbi:NAD(P)H-binding protein [Actinomadura barringtoniae]|uniref:NAD(P)H-binding protein n=1 Tax=Actinomadura barringtoniae TaxID=1427535 RepID=A0A939PQR1_9ACTN|nr:NAD(P)H-binding protein [Actinomadura barringtoniae]MBO2453001.1 NAD(P)H-binding protein [Actinomadura barringtoniae]
MRVAVAGGTGTLGSRVAEELHSRGHEVRVLGRTSKDFPVDLTTGEGLARALEGCEVVVDASNSQKNPAEVMAEGSLRLLEAEDAAGVGHHVCVSIVGCDRVSNVYNRAKVEQEGIVADGPVPWTVVRATQFHDLLAGLLDAAGRWRVVPVPRVRLQTVACADVARAVADVAEGPPLKGRLVVAGPEITDARAALRTWRSVTGRRALRIPIPVPGRTGRALRGGVLTEERPDVVGETTFQEWLEARR